jgi:hypothetical protein
VQKFAETTLPRNEPPSAKFSSEEWIVRHACNSSATTSQRVDRGQPLPVVGQDALGDQP